MSKFGNLVGMKKRLRRPIQSRFAQSRLFSRRREIRQHQVLFKKRSEAAGFVERGSKTLFF
jgi:hypothetical protein